MLSSALSLISLCVGLLVLPSGFLRLRGTTLLAAWAWLAAALVAMLLAEIALLVNPAFDPLAVRFAAAVGLFCPTVALLGAKRPQHSAWQWIVLALWAMLALPAAEVLLLRPGQSLATGDLRGWFLWALVGIPAFNYLPTRFAVAAMLFSTAHAVLLAPHLPFWRADAPVALGHVLLVAAMLFAALAAGEQRRAEKRDAAVSNEVGDRVWMDFRNLYGVLWTLRVAERFSDSAAQHGWPMRLTWDGFVSVREPSPTDAPSNAAPPSTTSLPLSRIDSTAQAHRQNLLRRFVSGEWLAAREPR